MHGWRLSMVVQEPLSLSWEIRDSDVLFKKTSIDMVMPRHKTKVLKDGDQAGHYSFWNMLQHDSVRFAFSVSLWGRTLLICVAENVYRIWKP